LEDYCDRLFNSTKLAGIELETNRNTFRSIILELQNKNGLENGAFKVIVSGGYSDTLDSVTGSSNLMILNVPWNKPPLSTFEEGVFLISSNYIRPHAEIKTLNYFNTLSLRKRMAEFRAADVLLYGKYVSEASRANLFFVKNGEIVTPGKDILHGITRKQVLKMVPGIRIENVEAETMYDFDEIFMTSTSRDVTPVVRIDGIKIGNGRPGKITRDVMNLFNNANTV